MTKDEYKPIKNTYSSGNCFGIAPNSLFIPAGAENQYGCNDRDFLNKVYRVHTNKKVPPVTDET